MQKIIAIAVVTLAVLLGGTWYLTRPAAPTDLLPGAASAQTSGEVDTSTIVEMTQGDADAPIQMIEYASYTCPHCATFHQVVYPQLKADYIDTGKVHYIYREVYFDRFGLWASMVARCGGEDRFFGLTEMLYERQRDWTAGGDPATIAERLRTIGKTAGLDDAALEACLGDAEKAQTLVAWFEENAAADDVTSTPSFIIDGQKHANMSFAELQAILDAKLD